MDRNTLYNHEKSNMKNLLIILLVCLTTVIFSQTDSIQLIQPTGKYPVGTMIYAWTDNTREIQLTSHKGDKRKINVQLWYPAKIDSHSIRAPYSALSKDYSKVQTNSYLRPSFHEEIESSNLIIFSPGRGTERFLYTTIIEELASHGYIVASVDMPHIGYVVYQDGLVLKPSLKFKPPGGMMGGPYEKVDKFFEEPTELGFEDLKFAYHKILELNTSDPNIRFTKKINLQSIGLFGHSLGGRIAGKFVIENKNVKAYISMEGIPPREIRYEGKINIPIAMLCSSGTWPYAKENYFSLINNRSSPVYMIELIGFGHNSVTDNPFIYPESFNYGIDAKLALQISREIVLNYFKSIFHNEKNFGSSFSNLEQIKFKEYK
jgi:hypothetical protein